MYSKHKVCVFNNKLRIMYTNYAVGYIHPSSTDTATA